LKGADGQYLNLKTDKKVWALWAEGRVHGDFEAIETSIGYIPRYDDLNVLFDGAFDDRHYTREEYADQFSIRVGKYLEKFDRMETIYREETDMPVEFWQVLKSQRKSLEELKKQFGKDVVSPFDL